MTEFLMPSLGADMDEGTLVEWLKQPGDTLRRGDVMAVVETQKGAIEIEVFHDGVLEEIVARPGATLPVGAVLATIRTTGGKAPAAAPPPVPLQPTPPKPVSAAISTPRHAGDHKVTPAARREAARRNIDLAAVAAGPDGIVGLREIREIRAAGRTEQRATGVNFDEMRKAIGAAMARSKREIPHYYVGSMIDLTVMMDWLARENAARPVTARLLPVVPIMKACALALMKVQELNGQYVDERFVPAPQVKMGVGIAMRGGGLIAPAIEAVESRGLNDIMTRLADLTARVRGGRLRSSELMEATVTFSSLGEGSADILLPVIYPPQVAIIGVGRIDERPWVVDGIIAVRKLASFTLAGDHRVNDGRSAARFLKLTQSVLEEPEAL